MSDLELATLPKKSLNQLAALPTCPSIYFALNETGHVLYIGQAQNLQARWRGKGHHRLDQLLGINRKQFVEIAWLDCSDRINELDQLEAQYIDQFHPLLNQTPVLPPQITPAEVTLQTSLEKIAKYCVVFGTLPTGPRNLPVVIIKYFAGGRAVSSMRRIFSAIKRRPTGLQWIEFIRRKDYPWWRTKCNGVELELGPWLEPIEGFSSKTLYGVSHAPDQDASLRLLAGVPIRTLNAEQLVKLKHEKPLWAENHSQIQPYQEDSIPLLWKGFLSKQRSKRASN